MIIHHMADGTIRKSIDGFVIPIKFTKVYELANKENRNGKNNKSKTIEK